MDPVSGRPCLLSLPILVEGHQPDPARLPQVRVNVCVRGGGAVSVVNMTISSGVLSLNITLSLNIELVPFLTWLGRSDQSSSLPVDALFV